MLLTFFSLFYFFIAHRVNGQVSYANDFVDPNYIVAGNFGRQTTAAQAMIVNWANEWASQGPWSVVNKSVTPPSGDKHDYMSWAPYWWPDCSNAGNTTELTPEQIWTTCNYVQRDGQFNPDGNLVDDVGGFQLLSDAVLYNAIAGTFNITSSSTYSQRAASFIKTWFLDEATRMNPNLNFGQMQRGPDGQTGSHTGVLDLKSLVKVTSGILILRKTNNSARTPDMDTQMNAWCTQYIQWLETAKIAIEEGLAENNHGTFYYNQLASLKILVNDIPGAKNVTDTYFSSQYMFQIAGDGEQPLEALRTRPYHYRAYNLAAMITNARLAKYTDPTSDPWHKPTANGTTIKNALDFAMNIPASHSEEDKYANELYPDIAAVASVYGDADGRYLSFMKAVNPNFLAEPFTLWDQPWAENEIPPVVTIPDTPGSNDTEPSGESDNSGALNRKGSGMAMATVGALFSGLLLI